MLAINTWYYIQSGVVDGTTQSKLIMKINDNIENESTEFAFVTDRS